MGVNVSASIQNEARPVHGTDTSDASWSARCTSPTEFNCGEPGCAYVLHSPVEYEHHYNSSHVHVCSACGQSLPSERVLELHISETHDPFFKVLNLRQPMYECFIEGCALKFMAENDRRQHLVVTHQYSSNCLDL
ncbi:hypothetical protein SARC_06260 [Sphaeroforma arctica JP610]|uniref:C2H2-type domain-containing protein n=1 Tax=Sphaeroforma arctica JP610 TaxID=667725 RepID=A0A0L0FXP2_9EUKA|nr:hypothetical protein SARC_06260 [Sphaeroforma arctica JP610]KNC81419.1 hypothetical protein SARC_06260 [Sphaeroforma arctica JP610]|eukprot:XP_014155321.1 hypothetical protein SARC_06260 [Sphaeroforma arctica JP610]